VEFSLFCNRVEVVLSDGGRAFESTLADPADLSILWDQSAQDGWGLLLAQQAMDEFSYTRTNEINRWQLVKLNRPLATKLAKIEDSRCG
jgi:anti-sigma regulatory factor (Ser/Thr protein kinase)